MSALFRKLNLKDHDMVVILNAPPSFESELAQLEGVTVARTVPTTGAVGFGIGFAVTQKELDAQAGAMAAAADSDAVLWIAYPKQSSKRYRCEFNRDTGWTVFAAADFEPVRMVAIDDDWSALRFRRTGYIKSMTRAASRAQTAEAKRRTTGQDR
ncbi:MAG TPA: hypothetical protein VE861_05350 [Gemmatimonadaceae bacterium]|nr:hypothetical protein [Gemmatimonadaceae bacterium]